MIFQNRNSVFLFHLKSRKMKAYSIFFSLFLIYHVNAQQTMKHNKLTKEEERVIVHKGTEMPFSGEYYLNQDEGSYLCKRCDAPLYTSDAKFDSGCGWPSFDEEIPGAVKRVLDADGRRTEILCANCGAHLGHVFEGEGFTDKNIRHCVNSISLTFEPLNLHAEKSIKTVYFASGCFWGTEHMLKDIPGVISTKVGYIGGKTKNPTYKQVCTGLTGHAEALELVYNADKVSFEKLAKLFFETHDPTQLNRQGPDVGNQYRSAVFYTDENQKLVVLKLMDVLKSKGYKVVTEVEKASVFYEAEEYHQDYYEKTGKQPYCHFYTKRF